MKPPFVPDDGVHYTLYRNTREGNPNVICIQWFDVWDYDPCGWVTDKLYDTEEEAEEAKRLVPNILRGDAMTTNTADGTDVLALRIHITEGLIGSVISPGSFVDNTIQLLKGMASRHLPAGEEDERCAWCRDRWPCADIQAAWDWARK